MSFVTVCCCFALTTSTIGVSPMTVIVSLTAPTFRSALTVAANDPVSSMPFPPDRTEPGQAERDGVAARSKIFDAVLRRCRR